MRENLVDELSGATILETIFDIRFEAADEFTHLVRAVGAGRGWFQLEGDELEEYVRRCLHSILEHGALPAINVGDEWPVMKSTTAYGTKPDEIVENVIGAWKKSGIPNQPLPEELTAHFEELELRRKETVRGL